MTKAILNDDTPFLLYRKQQGALRKERKKKGGGGRPRKQKRKKKEEKKKANKQKKLKTMQYVWLVRGGIRFGLFRMDEERRCRPAGGSTESLDK
jgi:hypothetical protein